MSTIVVGYVPRPTGNAALEHAAREARLRDCSLVVVHSRTPARPSRRVDMTDADAELSRAVAHELCTIDVQYELSILTFSVDPAEDLLSTAAEKDAELLVIGIRRRSAVGKLIVGSTAQRVLLDAPCPVLAVRSD